MQRYNLVTQIYASPTPAGAYYAASTDVDESARQLLFALMTQNQSQLLTIPRLLKWTDLENEQQALELLYRVQSLRWIQGETTSRAGPSDTLEVLLPKLLALLSGSDKALLADHMGFYLATYGFSHETAEELSALSADLALLNQRHNRLLHNNLGYKSAAWSIVDGAGDGQLGFWPLYIGKQRFSLVLAGVPQFNQPAFTELVWALSSRYH